MRYRFFLKHGDGIRTALASGKLPAILTCLAMVLVVGSVGTGLQFDDYIHREKLLNPHLWPNDYGAITGLFAFGTGAPEQIHLGMEYGMVPWWTFERVRAAFFRPVAAMTHWLDYKFWPFNPALMHVHSLLWFGVLIFVTAGLYRKLMTPLWMAGLAALLYAIDDAHGIPAGWLANRNAIIAAVFGFLTLLVHHNWRRDRWKAGAFLGPLLFLISLLSAEAGVATGAYLLSYEVFLVHGRLRKRMMAMLPYALVGIGWWLMYKRMGFGTWGGGAYLDPSQEPLAYLAALVERMPVLLFGQWLFPNAVIYGFLPDSVAFIVLVGVYAVLAGIVVVLIPILKRDAVARFWALGMVLALLPVSATFPDNRLLLFVGLGGMGLLAQFLGFWLEKAAWLPTSRLWRAAAMVFSAVFVGVHLIVAPLFLPFQCQGTARLSELALENPLEDMSQHIDLTGKTIIFVNPPVPFVVTHTRFICQELGLSCPRRTRVLASGLAPHLNITRVDDFSLEIEPSGGFMSQDLDLLYRGTRHPMQIGQRVELTDMVVQVLELTEDKRPKRARFTFIKPLDDPSLCFYEWKGQGFEPLKLPKAGHSFRLAMAMMPL